VSTPESADPWADPAWRPELAPPVSDGLVRAIGDYCAAENAKAEPSFIGGLPEDRITVNADHEIVTAEPDPDEPVPFTLTSRAEAELESPRDPYPGTGDPERLAEWCGFPSAAAMDAAYAEYERDMTEASEADARWEAEMEAEAATAEDPEAEL
jgi:hypothetical protein